MIEKITSRQNERIKDVIKLYDSKVRKEKGLFIVEGFHLLEMGLLSNSVKEIYTLKEIEGIKGNVKQYLITEEILQKISKNKNPQSVIAVCRIPEQKDRIDNHALYLDGISDPGNMGTILRTALAFDYKTVIVSKECVSIYNEKVIQASQGAIFNLNTVEDDNYLPKLKENGYQIIATVLDNSVPLKSVNPKSKFVIVLGNEARGVSKPVQEISDLKVRIEMSGIDSLNVGVAAGIAMYELKNR